MIKKTLMSIILLFPLILLAENWELGDKGISYNKAAENNLLANSQEQSLINIYILDDFSNSEKYTHGEDVLGTLNKISPHANISSIHVGRIGSTNIISLNNAIKQISNNSSNNQYRILNMSLDYYGDEIIGLLDSMKEFLNKSDKHYIIVASGNENSSFVNEYCNFEHLRMLCIAATNNNESKTNYSNYGSHVHLSAPSGQISYKAEFDLIKNLNITYINGTLYEKINGTLYSLNESYVKSKNDPEFITITRGLDGFSTKEFLIEIAEYIIKEDIYKYIYNEQQNEYLNAGQYLFNDLINNHDIESIPDSSFIKLFDFIERSGKGTEKELFVNNKGITGTSFAAPIVVGVLSHILAKENNLPDNEKMTSEQIINNLIFNGDYIASFDNIFACNLTIIKYDNYTCNGYTIKYPRKVNIYESLNNLKNIKPTTIKTTNENNKLSDALSTREWDSVRKDIKENDSLRWGNYRKPTNTDVFDINNDFIIDQNLNSKNLTVGLNTTVTFENNPVIDVSDYFENRGYIKGCFSDNCNYIGSLNNTANSVLFLNNGMLDINTNGFGIFNGTGTLNIFDSCNGNIDNERGKIEVFYNKNNCNLKSKLTSFTPKVSNLGANNEYEYNASGNHYVEEGIVILNKPETSLLSYDLHLFDAFHTILNYNIVINGRFSTKKLDTNKDNKEINIFSVEGYNYNVNEWQLNNLFFDLLNLHSTIINTYQSNKIYAKEFYLINSEINGNPQLFVNSFNNIGSTLNLSHLTIENEEGIEFELNNSGTLNISDTLKLENLGEINASDLIGVNDVINKLHVGENTHLKIDVDLEIGDLQLDNNSSIEILENKTLNIKNITSTNQLNDVNNNSLIYGDGFIGINNFYCTSNRVTDFGDVNVSFYTAKFGSSTNSCTVIADKVNFVSFQNNPSKSSAYGTVSIGSLTKKTDLYFNSDFNYSAINFTMLNETADTFVNSNSTIKELRMKKGKILNNGTLNAAKVRTSIGSFFEGNAINNTGYIIFEGNEIIFDEDIKVYKPYFTNNTSNPKVDISANVHFHNIVQNITVLENSQSNISPSNFSTTQSSGYTFTIEGICNKIINYEGGTVNLENIKLYDKVTGRYARQPCEINADTVNLVSLDPSYDQKDLYGNINNLNIYTQSSDDIQLGIVGNLNNYSTNLKLTPSSSIDGDINNFGSMITTSSLIHLNGYLNNSGTLQASTLVTNVLGNRTGSELILNATSISGQGEVNTLGTGTVENLVAVQNDYVVLNHDFTFISPRVYNFQGTHNAYFEGTCSGYYNYPEGQIYLNNIKMERHSPNSYYSSSIGCDLTTGDVFLQSYDETFNSRNLLVHGNLYVETSNESDSIMFQIDSGNLFIGNNSIFNVESGSSIDTELMQISSGSKLLSTGGVRIYDTDVINDGEIEVSTIYASRIGHFDFEKLINAGSYSLEGDIDGRITVESAVEIDNLRLSNTDDIIVLDYPLTVNNTNSTLRFEGTENLTVTGLCRNELYFETGTIELSEVQLQVHTPTAYYTPSHGCLIEAENTHLLSLDLEYDSRDLFIKGNLIVFNTNEDLITLNISEGNLILNDNVDFKLTSTAYLDTDLIQVNQGSRLYVNGGIKSYDSDVILNGTIESTYFETSRLGHLDGSKLNISSYTVSGYENGIVTVESEGVVDNIRMVNSDDVIMMNYPFRFNGTNSTLRFDGASLVTISDFCKNEIFYETGNVDLTNVKLQLHRLNAPYGSNPTHGCLVTAANINLQSMDIEYNNVDLITNGNLNINSNSTDKIKVLANGTNISISQGASLNIASGSEFNAVNAFINGDLLGDTVKIPTANIILADSAFIHVSDLQTERLGHVQGFGIFTPDRYTIINKSIVETESEMMIPNLVAHGGNLEVIMNHNFTFFNLMTNLELSGSKVATLRNNCNKKVKYLGGTVNLSNIRLMTPQNNQECNIEASTINLNSFDNYHAQRKLKSVGNLYINGSYTNTNYLQFDHTGYARISSTVNIWYPSNFNDRLDIFGRVNFKLGNYSHNGYLLNNGELLIDSGKYLIVNGILDGHNYYQIEECKFYLNGTRYKYPTDLTECD